MIYAESFLWMLKILNVKSRYWNAENYQINEKNK